MGSLSYQTTTIKLFCRMVDSDPKTDLTGLTTDLYIIAGSLGGVCLILIIWQIIVSVQLCNLRKRLTKRVQSNEHEPQIVENVPRPNFESGPTKVDDVASRYVQYPPQPQPHMNNQAMSLPYGGNVEAKYDPQGTSWVHKFYPIRSR